MADAKPPQAEPAPKPKERQPDELAGGAYELIRQRLVAHGNELRTRLGKLNAGRREVFGSIEPALLSTERISTDNNCVPRDMVPVGNLFLFGYNVHIGLRTETVLSDVFAVYAYEDHTFRKESLDVIGDDRFEADFKDLYRYYRHTRFAKFAVLAPYLHMVFCVGRTAEDIKTFKWLMGEDGSLTYVDNRSDHEFRFPAQHEFEWTRTHRDMQRAGQYPHISIDDRVFVETLGGDLTIKVEDNTDSGEGIYSEPVENPDQTLDDAEVFYANVGNLILLKIRPYQEDGYRYIVYSEKVQQACRIDAIEHACALLPEDHGIIFSNGYYLQTGEHKQFEGGLEGMMFERRVRAPNGEDTLYVFYTRESGTYVLLSYNVIEQRVQTPIVCHGWCLFDNGELIYFKAHNEPRKTHGIQVWRTPYISCRQEAATKTDSFLYKIGNSDIVRCMAACQGVLSLISREDTYANLYLDITRLATEVLDTHFWVNKPEAFAVGESLGKIREAAGAALEEFDKVVRVRRHTRDQTNAVSQKAETAIRDSQTTVFESVDQFVGSLGALRSVRGEVISLRELRYCEEERINALDREVQEQADRIARRCVDFLLRPEALQPYRERIERQLAVVEPLEKVTEARELEGEIAQTSADLELLVDVVSTLKMDDATDRTRITEDISALFAMLNRVRADLRNRLDDLVSREGAEEFASQMKLLNQAVINYLDVCDTPDRCEEYLSKLMIQVEELEGKFADFDEFVGQLTEKREDIYNTFETRKVKLVEARNSRADTLSRSAERILKGIRTRANGMDSVDGINGYFAADIMINKVRDVIDQLNELGDPVKAGDIQAQLKTIREDAVRQLKDREELFVAGEDIIKLGRHQFSVNTQALDLTVVQRDDRIFLHLTGTDFFELIEDDALSATRDVWGQEVISENGTVYRGEYLAYLVYCSILAGEAPFSIEDLSKTNSDALTGYLQEFMAPRYEEGYLKGVTDHDAVLLAGALTDIRGKIDLLRYDTLSRAMATVFWHQYEDVDRKALLEAKARSFGRLARLFAGREEQADYVAELTSLIESFPRCELFRGSDPGEAGEYLFHVLARGGERLVSQEADRIHKAFMAHIRRRSAARDLQALREEVDGDNLAPFEVLRDWVGAFLQEREGKYEPEYRDEVAAHMYAGGLDAAKVASASVSRVLKALRGSHPVIEKGTYRLHYNHFMRKLRAFDENIVPEYRRFMQRKKVVLESARESMRLDEFKPRVLTSFVRNKLLDEVYLPLIGDNLAKQVGVVGDATRTDRMGLLMLVSPPGYGKTTLMEYMANRLGIIFMKINGPAIGHRVTSLDPAEAPNAAAASELEKLNLALEMGDNIMIYVDDIQHCNPEFLQKFISLCDAQRKMEGVYKGRTRTYDLRGKRVCVVMAGNPYTESGEMFKVPDMLANRSDTYNLGDIIGSNSDAFELSYLENALTSNPTLSPLASRSRDDIHSIIRISETGSREGIDLEGQYTTDEMSDYVAVMRMLLRVRDVVLTVNQEYIRSAAQSDEYRTEPVFKLQGSYRNMNRIAEKIHPIMNDQELETLIFSDYDNEAQTLTTGAEANLLKLKEMFGTLSGSEAERWDQIKRTFARNVLVRGAGGDDRFGQVVAQLSTFSEGLHDIRQTIDSGIREAMAAREQTAIANGKIETTLSEATVEHLMEVAERLKGPRTPMAGSEKPAHDARAVAKLLEQQFALMQGWLAPGENVIAADEDVLCRIRRRMSEAAENYRYLVEQLGYGGNEIPEPVVKKAKSPAKKATKRSSAKRSAKRAGRKTE